MRIAIVRWGMPRRFADPSRLRAVARNIKNGKAWRFNEPNIDGGQSPKHKKPRQGAGTRPANPIVVNKLAGDGQGLVQHSFRLLWVTLSAPQQQGNRVVVASPGQL